MNENSYPYNMEQNNPFELVRDWMVKFERTVDQPFNTQTNEKDFNLCDQLIVEEFNEVHNELYPVNLSHPDPEKLTKELCDLIWVCIFCGVKFGLPLDAAFRRVYNSNMSKLQDDGTPLLREDGKILKGPNYQPVDLKDLF